jgi:hypothetical protein
MLVKNINDPDGVPQKTERHLVWPPAVYLEYSKEYSTYFIFLNCYQPFFFHFLEADYTVMV